ncbi:MAG: LuxR C-terminal-related transcriptional regulator [Paracoccaceae bacterium]
MTQNIPESHDSLIGKIYEIAAEPSQIEAFIDSWGVDSTRLISDEALGNHLDRASTFLNRLEPAAPNHQALLQRYDRFAALILSENDVVELANDGAEDAFGLSEGRKLNETTLPADVLRQLSLILQEARSARDKKQFLLRMDFQRQKGAALVRVQWLPPNNSVLIVSTHFQWSTQTDDLLKKAYKLTDAERNVVRLLVEGHDTKSISALRSTTEGTTRGQIKSIIAKMNLRSQVDIVRVAMMLGEMPELEKDVIANPVVTKGWLEKEVWKPFSSTVLQDGRKITYSDMGPRDGNPVLLSHLGSCMVRWSKPMLRVAFAHNLRVICPIRAGYGQSDLPDGPYDPLQLATQDAVALLDHLHIKRLPYVVQGSDFPLAAHFLATQSERVSELISLGGRPCLPDGSQIEGRGAWQKFFVGAARKAPKVTEFAATATMAMARRIGAKSMLRSLCKDSTADLALLEDPDVSSVLEANIALMSDKSSSSARAFANEFVAFQGDWSDLVQVARAIPTKIFIADQDPTFDLDLLPELETAHPEFEYQVLRQAGLALTYQHFKTLIPILAVAARDVGSTP